MFTSQRLTGLPAIDSAPAAALVLRLVILFRTRSCSSGGGYGTARAWEKRFPLEDEKGHSSKSRLKCRPDDLRMSDKACQDRMKVEGSLVVLLCLSEGETREKSRIKCWSRRLIWSSVTLRLIFTRTGRKIRLSVLECFILFGSTAQTASAAGVCFCCSQPRDTKHCECFLVCKLDETEGQCRVWDKDQGLIKVKTDERHSFHVMSWHLMILHRQKTSVEKQTAFQVHQSIQWLNYRTEAVRNLVIGKAIIILYLCKYKDVYLCI